MLFISSFSYLLFLFLFFKFNVNFIKGKNNKIKYFVLLIQPNRKKSEQQTKQKILKFFFLLNTHIYLYMIHFKYLNLVIVVQFLEKQKI